MRRAFYQVTRERLELFLSSSSRKPNLKYIASRNGALFETYELEFASATIVGDYIVGGG